MIVTLTRLDGTRVSYSVPNKMDVYRNFDRTYGRLFDRIERQVVEGGLPLAWERLDGNPKPDTLPKSAR